MSAPLSSLLHWAQLLRPALVVAALCLVVEGFFSGSEIAVIHADRVKVRDLADGGSRAGKLLQKFLAVPQRLLATTLVGTQIAIVASTVTLTLALTPLVGSVRADLYVLLGLTPLLVLFGEIVPKSIAQHNADRVAPGVVWPLWIASLVFAPIIFLMVRFAQRVARVLGVEAPRKLVSREDLELVVKGSARRGSEISPNERQMISRIFDFSERTASDVMVPLSSVAGLEETSSYEELVRAAEEKHFTRFPVYRERIDRVVGIVHTFDALKEGRKQGLVGQLMRPPIYSPENQPAVDLLVALQRKRQGMAVVVDEYGGAVGVVTIEDILEEIVGEIEDEHDTGAPAIRKEAEGVWRVRAQTTIQEVNRELKIGLPESDDYETLAGLVLEQLKRIPRVGESVRIGGVLVKVVDASERAVEEVELRLAKRRK